jgi:polyhydroxyalkanoate synthesis regulator phasin
MKLYRRAALVKYEFVNSKGKWITDFLHDKEATFTLKETPKDRDQLIEKIKKRLNKKYGDTPHRIINVRMDGWVLHDVNYDEEVKALHQRIDTLQEEVQKLKEQKT